jgi:hypothetical protein
MERSAQKVESPSQLIEARIKELGDWRGETLSRLRALIKRADPDVVEFRCGLTKVGSAPVRRTSAS